MRILRQRTFTLATELNLKAIKNAGLSDKLRISKLSKAVKNSGTGVDKLGRKLTEEQIALRQIREGRLHLNNTFNRYWIDPLFTKSVKRDIKTKKPVSVGIFK